MKKLMLAVTVTGLSIVQLNGQGVMKSITERLSGGLKAETNASNFILSDMPDAKSKMKIGCTFGGFVKIDLAEHFAIQEDLLISYNTSGLEQNGTESDYESWSFDLPIYFMGQWDVNNGHKFYFGVGPSVKYGFNATLITGNEEFDLYKKDPTTDKPTMNRLVVGGATIVGYELKCGLQMNAGYKLGLMNVLDDTKYVSEMRPGTLTLGVGYRF
ncbi:MAG: porin family protein [Breznakibacter sp.]